MLARVSREKIYEIKFVTGFRIVTWINENAYFSWSEKFSVFSRSSKIILGISHTYSFLYFLNEMIYKIKILSNEIGA